MATRVTRSEKVKRIFLQFDLNHDGGLNREEMAALVVAVNPRVKFSDEQINAILDEVFRTYGDFIDGDKGLTYEGLMRTYDDGAGDVDRDFDALGLELILEEAKAASPSSEASSSVVLESNRKPRISASHGVMFENTWKIVEDLEIIIKRLKLKQVKDGKIKGENFDLYSDPGWSRELAASSDIFERRVFWDESGGDYFSFVKEVGALRVNADAAASRDEAIDAHMAIATVLYEHQLFKEALTCFKRVTELQPLDPRSHFRGGNCLYILGKHAEARGEFASALEAVERGGNEWDLLLPQIHVNIGVTLETEGMVLNACEHYREAVILCPTHFRALKLLGSAHLGVAEYAEAVKALEEVTLMKMDFSDAHCDLASALHALGDNEKAIAEFQKAIDLKPGHVDALYNLGGLYLHMGRYQRATEMYTRVLTTCPSHWRAQVNKAASLVGADEVDEAKKALKEALKMTNRVELHDAISHLKQLQRKKLKPNVDTDNENTFLTVDSSKFKSVGDRTSPRKQLADALRIRSIQRLTRLSLCDVDQLRNEMNDKEVHVSYSGAEIPEKSIRKSQLEFILRRLLPFLKPEIFQGAVKVINEKILSTLDYSKSGRVDLGMFFAIVAPICKGSPEKRKKVAFDALCWRSINDANVVLRKCDAIKYIKLLRAIFINSQNEEIHRETDSTAVYFTEFLHMLDDPHQGFGILSSLVKLESSDRNRHSRSVCAVCLYPIVGSRFKEVKSHFNLCSLCYSEGKVPVNTNLDDFTFKEYESEADAMKDKCLCFSKHSQDPSHLSP